jgi:hypothetical protein
VYEKRIYFMNKFINSEQDHGWSSLISYIKAQGRIIDARSLPEITGSGDGK